METGTHAEGSVGKLEDVSDEKLMKEIDEYLNDEDRDEMDHEEHLKKLLLCQDKAMLIHHPTAKTRRQKALRVELQKLRRKMSLEKSGGGRGRKGEKGEEEEEKEEREVSAHLPLLLLLPPPPPFLPFHCF